MSQKQQYNLGLLFIDRQVFSPLGALQQTSILLLQVFYAYMVKVTTQYLISRGFCYFYSMQSLIDSNPFRAIKCTCILSPNYHTHFRLIVLLLLTCLCMTKCHLCSFSQNECLLFFSGYECVLYIMPIVALQNTQKYQVLRGA